MSKKSSRKTSRKPKRHAYLSVGDVKMLGRALIAAGDVKPEKFVSERDFYPLAYAFLMGRVPSLKMESRVSDGKVEFHHGKVDFHLGGNNPSLLELAVTRRVLVDQGTGEPTTSAESKRNELEPSQNKTELQKLSVAKPATLKARYLLLLDLRRKPFDPAEVERKYKELATITGPFGVRVVYVSRKESIDFLLKPRAKKRLAASSASEEE